MKGEGHYNRYSKLQKSVNNEAQKAIPNALKQIFSEGHFQFSPTEAFFIGDFGASQGRNSVDAIKILIKDFHNEVGNKVSTMIYHEDLPQNDWNTLFDVSKEEADEPNTFVAAIGRSYLYQVLPPSTLHFGWSMFAFHWLNEKACDAPHNIFPFLNPPDIKAKWDALAEKEWDKNISCRAKELKVGGKFIMVSIAEVEKSWFAYAMDKVLKDMIQKGKVTKEEYENTTVWLCWRTKEEIEKPLSKYNLRLDVSKSLTILDPVVQEFKENGDVSMLKESYIGYVRAWSESGISTGFKNRSEESRKAIIDEYYHQLEEQIAHDCKDPKFVEWTQSHSNLLVFTKTK